MSASRLHYATAHNDNHAVTVKAEQVDGEWWVQTTVDGVVKSYENIGPVDEVHPPDPVIVTES